MLSDDYLAWVRALEQPYSTEPLTKAEETAWCAADDVDWDDGDEINQIACERCDWCYRPESNCVCPMPCECNVAIRQAMDHAKTHQ